MARYRKFSLTGSEIDESGISPSPTPELSIFTTDFGVTFGQFICFDILHQSPTLNLIRDKNVTDIIFSSRWFSELPFLTALQVQFGFSYVNNVNFLGSGYNLPKHSTRGSAIFAGEKKLVSFWRDEPGSVLLMANVPKVLDHKKRNASVDINPRIHEFKEELETILDKEDVYFWQDDLSLYTTEIYEKNDLKDREICNGGLCCKFNINSSFEVEPKGSNFYR